jgi:cell division transport system ATP-binding protein
MISFKNVSKEYPSGTKALKDVSFNIDDGEFVFIVGPSGSGKSTMIKIMMKEEDADSGNIEVNGYNLSEINAKKVPYLRRSMGIVFQDFRLLQDKTVFENVGYAMQIVEATPRDIRRRVPIVLSLVGLSKKAKSYPNELSGGEQQRVALARALVNNPAVIIADEPTGNLDPENTWDIINLLCDINAKGTTIVVTTHERAIVNALKKRVIAIENGEIERDQQEGQY